MSYLGTTPNQDVVVNTKEYVATAGQTTFDVAYDNYVEVYLNGNLLSSTDYTATDGMSVVLNTGTNAGDIVKLVGFESYKHNNTVDLTTAQTISGTKTFTTSPKIPDAVNPDEAVSKGQLDASTKIVNITNITNNTRIVLSASADSNIFSFSFNKQYDDTKSYLYITGVVPGFERQSFALGIRCDVDGIGKENNGSAYTGIVYSGDYKVASTGILSICKTINGITSGSHTLNIGWTDANGATTEFPFNVINPNSSDDARAQQLGTSITIMEILI